MDVDEQFCGFPSATDPEIAAANDAATMRDDFATLMKVQLNLHLLMNHHVLLPAGYLFDNPALWQALTSGTGLRTLMLSSWERGKPTLSIAQHEPTAGDGGVIDAVFRTWLFGEDGKRNLSPSAPRIAWTRREADTSAADIVAELRERPEKVTFRSYLYALGLHDGLAACSVIEELFRDATSISTPSDRHGLFYTKLQERIPKWQQRLGPSHGGVKQLEDLLLAKKSTARVTRKDVQHDAPGAWKNLRNSINALRHECYFEQKDGRLSVESDPTFEISRPLVERIMPSALQWLSNAPWRSDRPRFLALDRLTFDHVAALREDVGLRAAIMKLRPNPGLPFNEEMERQADVLKDHWIPALNSAVTRLPEAGRVSVLLSSAASNADVVRDLIAPGIGVLAGAGWLSTSGATSVALALPALHEVFVRRSDGAVAGRLLVRAVKAAV